MNSKKIFSDSVLKLNYLYYKKSRVSPYVRHTLQELDRKNRSENVNKTVEDKTE